MFKHQAIFFEPFNFHLTNFKRFHFFCHLLIEKVKLLQTLVLETFLLKERKWNENPLLTNLRTPWIKFYRRLSRFSNFLDNIRLISCDEKNLKNVNIPLKLGDFCDFDGFTGCPLTHAIIRNERSNDFIAE